MTDPERATSERAAPIRVLMVIRLFYPWLGGTQSQADRLSRELIRRGLPVRLVTGWWFRGTPQRETIDGIPVFRNTTLWEFFGVRGLRKFGGYLYIATLLWRLWRTRRSYDVIHVHGLSYHTYAAALAGRWLHRPTIAKIANSGSASDIDKMRRGDHLALSRYMLPTALRCDRFVALNEAVVRELVAAGVPERRIVRIPNGIEVPSLHERATALHDPAGVVFVGRLHEQKGVDTLLRAFARLRTQRPDARIDLRLIGDGPRRPELEALARELVVDAAFLGERDDVATQLEDADVFVLPSRAEGMSNALLEAMTAGLPAIVTNIPGNADVIRHEQNGLLVEPDDADGLAAAIGRLLDDAALRERLGGAARDTVETGYALDRVATHYVALYEELLGTSADRAAEGVA
jgi:L-malate glycosyltransferase